MGRPLYFLLFLIAYCPTATGQLQIPIAQDPASQAMGGVLNPYDLYFQPYGNPSALAHIPNGGIAGFTTQPFGLPELALSYLYGWHKMGNGGMGHSIGYSGFGDLRQMMISSTFGHKLFNKLDLGIQIEGQETRLQDFGRLWSLGFAVGISAELRKDLRMGLVIRNPASYTSNKDLALPVMMIGTLGYRISEQLFIVGEWYQEHKLMPDFRFGLSYRPLTPLQLRIGYQSLTGSFLVGAGYTLKERLHINIAAGYHPYLGFSPTAGLIYSFTGKT